MLCSSVARRLILLYPVRPSCRTFRTTTSRLKSDDSENKDKSAGETSSKERGDVVPTAEKEKSVTFRKGPQALMESMAEPRALHRGAPEKQTLVKKLFHKPYESTYRTNRPIGDPVERTIDCFRPKGKKRTEYLKEDFDAFYDVCIIGGGVMGCSVAFHLADKVYKGLKICVVEKDSTYRKCATTLSVGGLRQQFSLPENVEMSLYGADFLRQAERILHVEGTEFPDINFQPHGYLYLASEAGAETLEQNYATQIECGAKVELLSRSKLSRRFPWLNTEGVALASYGFENEGWFDPWALLTALKIKAMDLGVDFIPGEVYNMAHHLGEDHWKYGASVEEEAAHEQALMRNRVVEAHIHLDDGDIWPLNATEFVICAGPESGHVASLCGIGLGTAELSIPLPVEPRKRYVYCAHSPDGPGLDCPLVVDPSGAYFRREGYGGHYLCGMSPASEQDEPAVDNLDVDHDFFVDNVWPTIAHRAPCFENLKVTSSWAGFYDYNYWDQNAIVGPHPYHGNVFFATGFSGHGIQQAPAIGRAIAELMLDTEFITLDLTRLRFGRVLNQVKVQEANVI